MNDFPVDDITLDLIEHAMKGAYIVENGEHIWQGSDFSLSHLLDFLSGYDPDKLEYADADGPWSSVPVMVYPDALYTKESVIMALIKEVRRLRGNDDTN